MNPVSKEEIEELISCPKIVIANPRREEKIVEGSYRNDMRLASKDKKVVFDVYFRRNVKLPERFSMGIKCYLKSLGQEVMLMRANSSHSTREEKPWIPEYNFHPHFNIAKPENIKNGLSPEKGGEITNEYNSYEEALSYFIKRINVQDAHIHFPNINQGNLFN